MKVQLRVFEPAGPFQWLWPSRNVEQFERSWTGEVVVDGIVVDFRHALGHRFVYGRDRVHSVTWVTGAPIVEGVEADDYERSRSLLSLLRQPDKRLARTDDEVPAGYNGFAIVNHRDEIAAPYSRRTLAVKIVEDNVAAWATHAAVRAATLGRLRRGAVTARLAEPPSLVLPADSREIVAALLECGRSAKGHSPDRRPGFQPTPDPEVNALVTRDPFAFLVGVIADQGMVAERAWRAPLDLQRRLGHLDPLRIAAEPGAVLVAVEESPKLHRFPAKFAGWVAAAARRIIERYGGDAGRIWASKPTARELYARLDAFDGVGQKKAAMAVIILERDLGVPIEAPEGSDVAYDINVRRVFLRTGLAERDDPDYMVAVARRLHPSRPAALDQPAWVIGRHWCHAGTPNCTPCPLSRVCPRLVYRAAGVHTA